MTTNSDSTFNEIYPWDIEVPKMDFSEYYELLEEYHKLLAQQEELDKRIQESKAHSWLYQSEPEHQENALESFQLDKSIDLQYSDEPIDLTKYYSQEQIDEWNTPPEGFDLF